MNAESSQDKSSEDGSRQGGQRSSLPLPRPMEIGDLLDEAFELYRHNFRLLLGIAILLDLPITMLQIAYANPGGFSWADWLALAMLPVALLALCAAVLDRLHGRTVTIAGAYGQILRRGHLALLGLSLYVLATGVLVGVLIVPGILLARRDAVLGAIILMMGSMLALAPGIILSLWGMLLLPVIVLENRGIGALSRSRRLAAGNMWRLFFLYLALLLVGAIFALVLESLQGLVSALTGVAAGVPPDRSNPTQLLAYGAVTMMQALVLDALLPLGVATSVLGYLDLRIRREAYDLELMTATVEARVAAARATPSSPGPAAEETADTADRWRPS